MKVVESWPEEDQEELAEYALEIQARRRGVYVMTDEERMAVDEGLKEADRGEFATDADVKAFWRRHGIS
jgi:hypothetical protein